MSQNNLLRNYNPQPIKRPVRLRFHQLVSSSPISLLYPSKSFLTQTLLTAGIGQSGPLTLIVALVQFAAPHAFLSTATGLAFSARAIGGAFGSAVLDAIINSKLSSTYAPSVSSAAIQAGLLESPVPPLLQALVEGGANP